MVSRHAGLAAALLGAAACVHSNVLVLDPLPRPETRADSVRLLGKEPQQPYTVIGLVSARVDFGSSVDRARRRLQKEAARLGGDALLFEAESLATPHKGGPQLSAKVIVFDRPPAPEPPPRQ